MMLAWRALIPISLALLMMTAIVVYVYHGVSYQRINGSMALTLLVGNVFAGALIMIITTMLPPAPATNRRLTVLGSRFNKPPTPIAAASATN